MKDPSVFALIFFYRPADTTPQSCRPPVAGQAKMAAEGGKRKRPFSRKRKETSAGGEGRDKAKPTTEEVTAEEKHLRDRQRKLREIALRERAHGREYKKAKWRRTIQ